MIPVYSISSLEFESDLSILKEFFSEFESKVQCTNGFRFSPEAKFAMGWWFYDVYFEDEFFKKLVEVAHLENPRIKDESGILDLVQARFVEKKSKARVKFHGQKPLFFGWWSWLMR